MEIRVKLMGTLKPKTPSDGRLALDDAATVQSALKALDIEDEQVHLVMVNNSPEKDRQRVLEADDELFVMAPVGGG